MGFAAVLAAGLPAGAAPAPPTRLEGRRARIDEVDARLTALVARAGEDPRIARVDGYLALSRAEDFAATRRTRVADLAEFLADDDAPAKLKERVRDALRSIPHRSLDPDLFPGEEDQLINTLRRPDRGVIKIEGHFRPEIAAPFVEVAPGDEIHRGRFLHRGKDGMNDELVADVESHVARFHLPVGQLDGRAGELQCGVASVDHVALACMIQDGAPRERQGVGGSEKTEQKNQGKGGLLHRPPSRTVFRTIGEGSLPASLRASRPASPRDLNFRRERAAL